MGLVCLGFVATSLTGSAQNAPPKPARVPAPVTTHAPAKPVARAAAPIAAQAPTAVVKQYCVTCHSDRRKTGGLSLEGFDLAQAGQHAEVGEKMIVKLRAGMMPPPGARRPDAATLTGLVTALETTIDAAAAANPNPGVRPFQRLNRPEYARAIKELLDLELDAGDWLPLDSKSANFDNIADAQALSPTLLESYLNAASAISRMAVGDRTATPNDAVYTNPSYVSQHSWDHVEGAPFGTRGGIVVNHVFPADAEYVFAVALNGGQGSRYEDVDISVDGQRVALLPYESLPAGGADGRGAVDIRTEPVVIKAGQRKIAAAFVKKLEGPYEDLIRPHDWSYAGGGDGGGGITNLPHLRDLVISGPFRPTGVSETPARQKIFTCRPTSQDEELRCARSIVTKIATEAYRRPVTLREIDRIMPFYQQGAAEGGFEGGVRASLEAILASPYFIFRLERAPAAALAGAAFRVADVDLASRLSFFLWGTPPDDDLIALAAQGKLSSALTLERHVRKMLADPRANALGNRFAAQWLRLQDVDKVHPDPNFFPNFDNNLAEMMRQETVGFFNTIVREDRSILDLYRADFTVINERLARHYGIPGIAGNQFRKVQYPDDTRRGVLGHGSVLVQTSLANRTSPVLRGKWVMEVLLGTPPPPPPPDIPTLEEVGDSKGGKLLTTRERMEIHRSNPTCNSCHRFMDPIGLALDNFDVTARWRVRENGAPLDTRGDFYDGTPVTKPSDLVAALLKRPEPLVRTFTENLLAYALGRRVEYFDQPTIRAISRAAAKNDYLISSFIVGVIKSDAFQMKGAERVETTEASKN
jgi:cytochrome c551/c552